MRTHQGHHQGAAAGALTQATWPQQLVRASIVGVFLLRRVASAPGHAT